jgi:hypothetical protein
MSVQLQPELPRANVLNYITTADSPTRVRQIASWAVLLLAIAYLALAMWSGYCGYKLAEYYSMYYRVITGPSYPGWRWLLSDPWMRSWVLSLIRWPLLLLLSVVCAAVLFICAVPVRRGRRRFCYLAAVALLPLMLVVLGFSAWLGGWALLDGTFLGGKHLNVRTLYWLIPSALLAVVAALIYDVMKYLRWIARNPITEKPKGSFLPMQGAGQEIFLK